MIIMYKVPVTPNPQTVTIGMSTGRANVSWSKKSPQLVIIYLDQQVSSSVLRSKLCVFVFFLTERKLMSI